MTYALVAMMCLGVIFYVCSDTTIPMWAAVPILSVAALGAGAAVKALSDDVTAHWRDKLARAERDFGRGGK